MNKYQEALDEIKEGGSFQDLKNAIDTLQELIDKFTHKEDDTIGKIIKDYEEENGTKNI